jgi:hypothetical protein
VLRPVEIEPTPVDSDATLLSVVLRPVDSEFTPLCAVLTPVEIELTPTDNTEDRSPPAVLRPVDNSEATLLPTVLRPVDRLLMPVAVDVDSEVNWLKFTASVEFAPAATLVRVTGGVFEPAPPNVTFV